MNNLGSIFLILICVAIGYVIEPILIADKPTESTELESPVADEEVMPKEVTEPPAVKETPSEIIVDETPEEVAPIEEVEKIETPSEQVEVTSTEVVETVSPPEQTPEPIAEPAPTPEPVSTELDEAAIVGIMKASVAEGKVTEFEASDVISWSGGEEFEFEGESYETGTVTFKTETILGIQEHDALALIKDGAVSKWLWAKTKLEMR